MAVNQSVEILMTRQLCLVRHSDAAPLRASWNGKVFDATVWRGKVATIPAPAQTHALPLTLPLFAFATQVFDSRVGGGSVQRLGAATVVLAGDRGRVASTCGSERGQRDLRGAQDAPPASLHHQHMH